MHGIHIYCSREKPALPITSRRLIIFLQPLPPHFLLHPLLPWVCLPLLPFSPGCASLCSVTPSSPGYASLCSATFSSPEYASLCSVPPPPLGMPLSAPSPPPLLGIRLFLHLPFWVRFPLLPWLCFPLLCHAPPSPVSKLPIALSPPSPVSMLPSAAVGTLPSAPSPPSPVDMLPSAPSPPLPLDIFPSAPLGMLIRS